jgi:hypothetical protein
VIGWLECAGAPEERALRADAARNAGRLLEAAHAVFAEQGPEGGMPEGGEGWRRHLLLVFDAFRPDGATPLASAPPEPGTDPRV